mmetsp:Transcript_41271/g.36614  ORF Transcript_41271/g.36614 Transcript_41271/m.36614 type:complete len:209 (-) Transcript_41271:344-970(-)
MLFILGIVLCLRVIARQLFLLGTILLLLVMELASLFFDLLNLLLNLLNIFLLFFVLIHLLFALLNFIIKPFLLVCELGNYSTCGNFQVQELLVLFIDFFNVFLIFNLELMEIDKLEIVTHFFFLLNLVLSLENLVDQRLFLDFIFVDKSILLLEFLLSIFLDLLSFDFTSSTILTTNQNFSLEIEGVLSDLGDSLISFLKNSSQSLEN